METHILLKRILPNAPGDGDPCVHRLTGSLRGRQGINHVHVVQRGESPALCVHHEAIKASRWHVLRIVKQLAAQLSKRFGHVQWRVKSALSEPLMEEAVSLLRSLTGVLEAKVKAPEGRLNVEYLRDKTGPNRLLATLREAGLHVEDS